MMEVVCDGMDDKKGQGQERLTISWVRADAAEISSKEL